MPAIDFIQLLNDLAAFIATAANLQFSGTPRSLWVDVMIEADSTLAASPASPASVLRIYDGSLGYVPVPRAMIQCITTALPGDDGSGIAQANAVFDALLDSNIPLRMKALSVTRINGILNLRAPGQIARDVKNRAQIVFNFEVEFIPTA